MKNTDGGVLLPLKNLKGYGLLADHIPSNLLKEATLFHGYFSRFLNCKNGTKSRKASHLWYCDNSFFGVNDQKVRIL